MKVNFNYLPLEFKNPNKIISEWKKLIKSTDFTLGKYVELFEEKFKKLINVKYCIATNNGTDALILCLKALNVKKGDEVITVCNSFYATAGAIVACGAKPIFVDCDERYQINIDQIEKKITKKTKVILPVHWGGASPNMKNIMKISKKYKLKVVEDACMGIGAKIKGSSPGTFGEISAFSMHPLKSLNVMGDAGAIVTNNSKLYKWAKKYRNHGMISRNKIDIWGENIRMQPLQAIVALEGIKKLKSVINKRNENAKILDYELSSLYPKVILPPRDPNNLETFALYMARFKQRNSLLKYLIKNKIEVKIHYPVPLHLQKPSIKLGHKMGDFKISEKQSKELLTLPVHQYLTKKQIFYMINKIKSFYKKIKLHEKKR